MGPGEKGAPGNHPEISSQKLADFECMEGAEHHFGPFEEKDFGGNIWRPPCSPGPFVLLLIVSALI